MASFICCTLLAPAAAGAQPVVGHVASVLDTPATITDPTVTAQRNEYVVLQAWEGERARELKAANPNLKVLAYQNLSAMAQGTGPGGLSSSGVNYAEANTAHPDWFLQEADGQRIAEEGYSWLWMADIGNPGYQEQWTANVLRL
ncbi:MAG TPA: putative glycoside hydrolase, partial [Solirubrobacteraceae bacterium]|nr:putative glycoside hydrolase [Solirubrobacteraceae bacterium]